MSPDITKLTSSDEPTIESDEYPLEQDFAPKFTTPIEPSSVKSGDLAIFKCKVEGQPKPELYWFSGNRKICSSRFVKISKENDCSTLTIKNVMPYDSGKYTVRAINRAGVKSSSATLTVKGIHLINNLEILTSLEMKCFFKIFCIHIIRLMIV